SNSPAGLATGAEGRQWSFSRLGRTGALPPHIPNVGEWSGLGQGSLGAPARNWRGLGKAPPSPFQLGPPKATPRSPAAGLHPIPHVGPSSAGGWERWALESFLTALLLLPLLLAAHFLYQTKHECHFLNGTQQVHYLYRDIYDRQEIVRFDSDVGKFVALTEFGQPDADYWNSDKTFLQYLRGSVDRFCRCHYGAYTYQAEKTRRLIGRR
ncbi:uncharacterized protein LOC103055355, partial [Python bivittatus]|uniref:Uncharacterized protein LOC103055355 n=1 Tax=Python bivittatus TaxID=176946 RepID=A0A9F2REU2_PYTBI